jgi:hypothetical protein
MKKARKETSEKKDKKTEKGRVPESELEKELGQSEKSEKKESKGKIRTREEFIFDITPNIIESTKAPVLEKVASGLQISPVFISRRTESTEMKEESDSFRYTLEAAKKTEPKYSNSGESYFSNLMTTPEKNLQTRDLSKREISFGGVADMRISDERKFERYETPKKLDTSSRNSAADAIQGRQEIKYKPLK